MKTLVTASMLAFGGLMTLGAGIAAADEVQVDGSYSTLAACQIDGPEVQIVWDNDAYTNWDCRQGGDGLYYLFLTN